MPDKAKNNTQQYGICYVKAFPLFTTDEIATPLHIFWYTLFIIMHNTLLSCPVVYPIPQNYDLAVVMQLLHVQYNNIAVVVYNCHYQGNCSFFYVSKI